VSPVGSNVYVAQTSNALTAFARGTITGQRTQLGGFRAVHQRRRRGRHLHREGTGTA
jgi:hypothetical protein